MLDYTQTASVREQRNWQQWLLLERGTEVDVALIIVVYDRVF